jgi:hypothetical protein
MRNTQSPTCLSSITSNSTSSIIVNFGTFPPCLSSSPSLSRSRGSYATFFPPSNAEPACPHPVLPFVYVVVFVGEFGDAVCVSEVEMLVGDNFSEPEAFATRHLESPFEVISWKMGLYLCIYEMAWVVCIRCEPLGRRGVSLRKSTVTVRR